MGFFSFPEEFLSFSSEDLVQRIYLLFYNKGCLHSPATILKPHLVQGMRTQRIYRLFSQAFLASVLICYSWGAKKKSNIYICLLP